MQTTPRSSRYRDGKVQQLDALAFYLGAHGIDPAPVKQEIEETFLQQTLAEKEEPLRKLRALEGKLQQVRKERPEVESLWQKIRKEHGDTPPPYFHAVLMAVCGIFAMVVDVIILAPSMDMLGVADPIFQYVAASGFAALFTAWFELSGLLYLQATKIAQKRSAMIAASLGVFCLIVWGLLRGDHIRFVAGFASNPLGDFLGNHPILAALFFIFATLATPVIAAYSLLYAWRDYSAASTWRRVRTRYESLRNAEMELPRQIHAETEQLEHFDRKKEAECREWKEIFNHYYDRGQKNGSRRESLWSVIWKAALGMLVGTALVVFMPKAWFLAEWLSPVIPGIALFLFFNHRRLHPDHERYLARENTKFAVIPEDPPRPRGPKPTTRFLSKGEDE